MPLLTLPPRYIAWGDLKATTDANGVTRYASPEPQASQYSTAQAESVADEETAP